MAWSLLALPGAIVWFSILVLPWRAWRVHEVLDAGPVRANVDLGDVSVIIPARNEAALIGQALAALNAQGQDLRIVLVDDQSSDGTSEAARAAAGHGLCVVNGRPLPGGWTGKLWALEQGRAHASRPFTLLIDADIALQPGILVRLREKMVQDDLQLVSLMAGLRMKTTWEKLLMPAFVYFFKLLYPFRLSNDPRQRRVAAAAGGCVLLHTQVLDELGGFGALRDALIDDCALARQVKARGYKTWVGLSHSVRSVRAYDDLGAIWNMVARSAFTQLRYSIGLLLGCTALFAVAFWLPLGGLLVPDLAVRALSALALVMMVVSYLPTLRFYARSRLWALALPFTATLYLVMTWTSAVRYWRGRRSQWKGRTYDKGLDSSTR
ncbi:MAG: glycosyltransferase [Gammaproteobacteria bacterium]|nr:MAG: glycosyltransferase [Gammaproteobacteria bacterium]